MHLLCEFVIVGVAHALVNYETVVLEHALLIDPSLSIPGTRLQCVNLHKLIFFKVKAILSFSTRLIWVRFIVFQS